MKGKDSWLPFAAMLLVTALVIALTKQFGLNTDIVFAIYMVAMLVVATIAHRGEGFR